MIYTEFIGIDVSKLTIDVWLYHARKHMPFDNTQKGFKAMLAWIRKTTNTTETNQYLFCFENTGLYNLPFCSFADEQQLNYCLESALRIKLSFGITRGKNDKVDAERIARYCYLHREELVLSHLPAKAIQRLKKLLSLRDQLVCHNSGFKACMKEAADFLNQKEMKEYFSVQKSLINTYEKKIMILDKAIQKTIDSDQQLAKINECVQSVPGIGPVITAYMLAYTNGFTAFDNWRQFACYIGIAPFDNKSGTSLKGKTRLSQMANKKIKTVVNSGTRSALQSCKEYQQYYNRRLEEGKNEYSTINIIRNKIISRAFACAKRKTKYVNVFKFAA
ncbi:IS110 family transposase [soil metagenome]